MSKREVVEMRSGSGPGPRSRREEAVIVPDLLGVALGVVAGPGRVAIWPPGADDAPGLLQLGPFDGSEDDLGAGSPVEPLGPVPRVYEPLVSALEARGTGAEVFAYDWRKDVDLAAWQLAGRLREREAVDLVAHGLGALVARRALQWLGASAVGRAVRSLVLLGPANFGTLAAAFALNGQVGAVELARRLGVEAPRPSWRAWASMTALYQALPWDRDRWPWLAAADPSRPGFWRHGVYADRLARCFGWARRLDDGLLAPRSAVILGDGDGRPTPGGVAFDGAGLRADPAWDLPGDGEVPHACAVLPGRPTFLVAGASHATLPGHRDAIEGVLAFLAGDRVPLAQASSEPADHRPGAPVADRPRAPRAPATTRELNGTFLERYDDGHAAPAPSAIAAHRRAQLRDRRGATILQASNAAGPPPPSLELILDESNLLPFHFLRTGDRFGRAVVKLQRGDGTSGTGFLVAPGVLLTNHHVLPDRATAAAASAVANFEADPPADPAGRSAVAPLRPSDLFVSNADLDFTFCAVEGLDHLGVVPLDRNSLNVLQDEYVNIVQHPRGRPKEVALQDNRVIKADNVVVQYSCDTEPGSSGSPVFNNQWRLVALHHASVEVGPPAGRRAAGADPASRFLNEGIRLSAIALWLETAEANAPGLRDQVARLRAIFGGLDPQAGFFGAPGRKAEGRPAAEVVVESYRGPSDALDVAFWDLSGTPGRSRDRPDDLAWALAGMGMDLWYLAGVGPEEARLLAEALDASFRVEYQVLVERPGGGPPLTILQRRSKSLSVARDGDGPRGSGRLRALVATRRGPSAALVLLTSPGRPDPDAADVLLLGAAAERLGPSELDALRRAGWSIRGAGAAADGSFVHLAGAGSRVEQVFVAPNLSPLPGAADGLLVASDRALPPDVHALGPRLPVALRLTFGDPTAVPLPPPASSTFPDAAPPAPSPMPPDPLPDLEPHLERALRDLLTPLIARMLAEGRGAIRDTGRGGDPGVSGSLPSPNNQDTNR